MKRIDLNSQWTMTGNGYEVMGDVPGSVYSFLMNEGLVGDPYYRDNEQYFLELAEHEYKFTKVFDFDKARISDRVLLHCDGLDTLCEIFLNEEKIAYTDNMHREYEFDITSMLLDGENTLALNFLPVNPYIKERHAKEKLWENPQSMMGIGHIRKNYCMMGWDWGPMLPDAGIWKDIYLLIEDSARITDVKITQRHENGKVFIYPQVKTSRECELKIKLSTPSGECELIDNNAEHEIKSPMLWWPAGLGDQPLYTVEITVEENGNVCDSVTKRIGLRTLELVRERDKYGESFYHRVNGVAFFAMGGDYIPEDNIMSRITYERSRKLLTQCKECNFNAIRIWGGGYYPHDWFFDICDELGLIVFMDLMFACTKVPRSEEFVQNITPEIEQNLKRIRHHACIAVISGNNEIEESVANSQNEKLRSNYIYIFEEVIRDIWKRTCPEIPFVPSSPSSCGHLISPTNEDYGDSHYWRVWHGGLPFREYRNHYFRYLSEFGFQSFPCEKTMNQVTLPEDRNIFSRIMEMHQRSGDANKKILTYLSESFKYPRDFGTLLYASQLLQSEAIRYGVEHLRRNRGRCMGTLYWQINDIWPVASWASIDYYGRFKALQYVAKRFYSPVLISCEEVGEKDTRKFVTMERSYFDYETKATLFLTNDSKNDVSGTVRWMLRNSLGEIIESDEFLATVESFSVKKLADLDFNKTDFENNYISFEFEVEGEIVSSGTSLFTAPKHFAFKDPNLRYEISGNKITVFADSYARYVEIYSPDSDFILSDNFFDMNAGSKTVEILEGEPKTIVLRSVFDIQ